MSLRVRFQATSGMTLVYSVERLADGKYWDFSGAAAFVTTPATLTASLPEGVTNFLGEYKATLATTDATQWTDGNYVAAVHNSGASNVVIGELGVVMHTQDDQPVFPVGGTDPWGVALPGGYTAGMAGYVLGHFLAADPWTTGLPGGYTPGQAGYVLGHFLDALVSSRLATSGYTAPDNTDVATILTDVAGYISTELAAVKAKTDQLTFSGGSNVATLAATALRLICPEPHAPTLNAEDILCFIASLLAGRRSGATGSPGNVLLKAVGDPTTTRIAVPTDGIGNVTGTPTLTKPT